MGLAMKDSGPFFILIGFLFVKSAKISHNFFIMKRKPPRNFKKIEKKWQRVWEEKRIYKNYAKKDKFYVLDMFPYPSGDGLHVGHPRGYIATDVISRFKTMGGASVLHPMGWDAFGLPAENFAIKNKIQPAVAVRHNIKRFKEQLSAFGFTYDWDREINTTDPEYYKWTQWIFLKLFENGLAYESFEPINWCPGCKTGLANEDLEDGKCERCGSEIEKKPMRQWVLKMTAYADRLLKDLDLLDWPQSVIEQQDNWIGRSEGTNLEFRIKNSEFKIDVFTTRVDTIFGCTYCVVAPEHKLIENLGERVENSEEVKKYVAKAKNKSDLQRTDLAKEKTGVELKGIKAINPFNDEEIPVFAADYVLGGYGTGAVMAVPAHDERDFEFAKKYGLKIKNSVRPLNGVKENSVVFVEDGILMDSGNYTGLKSAEARKKMTEWLEKEKIGGKKVNYKMHDWVFSRQRYWGEPIPLAYCESCKKRIISVQSQQKESKSDLEKTFSKGELLNPGWITIKEKDLPVKLPAVKFYEPTGTGESPLANIKSWVEIKCPKCGGKAKRETNTMPQWAGSSWYYLRYIDPKNKKALVDKKKEKEWLPVGLYVGGVEHATRHLLYARFWHKFLYDIGAVSTEEPFKKLMNQGLILAEDGRKMSKRWKNVVNPDDVINLYGADSLRLYEMFLGPFAQSIAWNTDGLKGVYRFLNRVADFGETLAQSPKKENKADKKTVQLLNRTIKKVTEDIENFRFNTAVSSLMVLFNGMEPQANRCGRKEFKEFLKLLAPFAPHLSEELWQALKNPLAGKSEDKFKSIHGEEWPSYNSDFLEVEEIELVIQINGKVRGKILAQADISENEAEKLALQSPKIVEFLGGRKPQRIIFVPKRLINIVI